MSIKPASDSRHFEIVGVNEPSSDLKAVAVGDTDEWMREGNFVPREGMAFLAFHDVDEETLSALRPAIVFSPLLANTFDCIELALLLSKLGYGGKYRAVSENVPKPEVIEREVRQLCPKLDFRIVERL